MVIYAWVYIYMSTSLTLAVDIDVQFQTNRKNGNYVSKKEGKHNGILLVPTLARVL